MENIPPPSPPPPPSPHALPSVPRFSTPRGLSLSEIPPGLARRAERILPGGKCSEGGAGDGRGWWLVVLPAGDARS